VIYMAGLTLVARKEGEEPAHETARGAVLGAVALLVFAVAADFLTPAIGWLGAVLAAAGIWFVAAFALYALARSRDAV
jgi:amino acid transporter